jgi:hypothetical protein
MTLTEEDQKESTTPNPFDAKIVKNILPGLKKNILT